MNEHETSIYVMEIKKQSWFAMQAINTLNNVLQNYYAIGSANYKIRNNLHNEIFRQIHSFLTHTSNVSRIFWPPSSNKKKSEIHEDREKRGKLIRQLFGITESSCLKNRTLRDHLEHYDERLDDWRRNSKNKNVVIDFIGGPSMLVGLEQTDIFRGFNPSNGVFFFRGESFDIKNYVEAVNPLINQAEKLENELQEKLMGRFMKENKNFSDANH